MKVWTHRGFPYYENQLDSFKKCYINGIRHFETDIHSTKDGILILSHDSNLERLTGINSEIDNLDYSELQDISRGIFEFSRLDDLLKSFPDVEISIDIKHDAALIPLVNLLREFGEKNLVVGSFNGRRIKKFRNELPKCKTALTTSEILKLAYGFNFKIQGFKNKYAMVPIKFKGVRILNKKFLARCKKANIPIYIWTVNSLPESIYLAKLGVSGIVTDDFRLYV